MQEPPKTAAGEEAAAAGWPRRAPAGRPTKRALAEAMAGMAGKLELSSCCAWQLGSAACWLCLGSIEGKVGPSVPRALRGPKCRLRLQGDQPGGRGAAQQGFYFDFFVTLS